MRKKTIPFVKILWRNHSEWEATWETEESIRTSQEIPPCRYIFVPLHFSKLYDAFSFNFMNCTTASPGNISPDPPDNLSKYLLASPAILPFHNVQAYNDANKPPIPPQDLITPPTILTPSLVLLPSPLFDP
nr:hypothetical protein [Tanacetum cinerariifolium]